MRSSDKNLDKGELLGLSQRRQTLLSKCECLRTTLCLLIAVALFATESTTHEINAAMKEMGFKTELPSLPPLEYNAVGLVTFSTLVLTLAFSLIWEVAIAPDSLSKQSVLRFAFLFTIGYAVVQWLAIHFKRKWKAQTEPTQSRPENLLIALYAYVATLPINFLIGYILRGYFTYASFLYAVNQAILGYFVGMYIDKSLRYSKLFLISMTLIQAAIQTLWLPIATYYSPPLEGQPVGLLPNIFSIVQTFGSSCAVGFLFSIFLQVS